MGRASSSPGEMQLHTTFMFVIVASGSLVLIFYFMSGKTRPQRALFTPSPLSHRGAKHTPIPGDTLRALHVAVSPHRLCPATAH